METKLAVDYLYTLVISDEYSRKYRILKSFDQAPYYHCLNRNTLPEVCHLCVPFGVFFLPSEEALCSCVLVCGTRLRKDHDQKCGDTQTFSKTPVSSDFGFSLS